MLPVNNEGELGYIPFDFAHELTLYCSLLTRDHVSLEILCTNKNSG